MKKNWWKILGVLLVLYSLIVGMLVPLKPGVLEVHPSSAKTGEELTLKITAYNTNFTKSKTPIRAWLKLDKERSLAAITVKAETDNLLTVKFVLPSHLPITEKVKDFTLIIDNDFDGAVVMPSAVFVSQNNVDLSQGKSEWKNTVIKDLNIKSDFSFPFRNILNETIRNIYYHVSLWFAMVILFMVSVFYSWKYLKTSELDFDRKAAAFTKVGVLFGVLGCATGAIWAKATWGTYWTVAEIKLNMAAIALLIYFAYFILRSSFDGLEQKAKISAVYSIFAFAALIPLIFVIPRIVEGSLHPGNGGNPGLGGDDLDNTMRMVFYPAIIGWILIGIWMSKLAYRVEKLQSYLEEDLDY